MYASNLALKQHPVHFTIALVNGHTLSCPAYPDECTWAAVHLDGVEIHRITADALAAAPQDELTRLADALIPGRPENPDLPQCQCGEWHECAVAVAESGRTIRFEPAPKQVERVRICERDGQEIAYWVDSEFGEDASECLGAAIGALAGGTLPTIHTAASRNPMARAHSLSNRQRWTSEPVVELDRTTGCSDIGDRPGHPQRRQASNRMPTTPPSRSFAAPDHAPTTSNGNRAPTVTVVQPPPPTVADDYTHDPLTVWPQPVEPQSVSFELSGPLTSGLVVFPPDRARPYWRDDHGHRFVLDQVLASEPHQQPVLDAQVQAIVEVARALVDARLAGEHTRVSALTHTASRLCNEIGGRVAPGSWQPRR